MDRRAWWAAVYGVAKSWTHPAWHCSGEHSLGGWAVAGSAWAGCQRPLPRPPPPQTQGLRDAALKGSTELCRGRVNMEGLFVKRLGPLNWESVHLGTSRSKAG